MARRRHTPEQIHVNPVHVERIEQGSDSIVVLTSGRSYRVKKIVDEIAAAMCLPPPSSPAIIPVGRDPDRRPHPRLVPGGTDGPVPT